MKQLRHLFAICIALGALLLSSCENEALIGDSIAEGKGALLKLSLKSSDLTQTKAALANDQAIDSVDVLIFDSSGVKLTHKRMKYSAAGMAIETISGMNRTIYVLANVSTDNNDGTYSQAIASVTTKAEFDNLIVTLNANYPITQNKLIMTGTKTNVDITPGNSTLTNPIVLHFVSARIDFKIVNAVLPAVGRFQPVSWDVADVPIKSYVMDKGTDAAIMDSSFRTTSGAYRFPDPILPNEWGETFYTLENRRGGRAANSSMLPQGYTPGVIGSTNDKDKAWYAPRKATHLMIEGIYYPVSGSSQQMSLKIYLGENNYNDYNVIRGHNQQWTITVTGFNEVLADSNVESATSEFSVATSATLLMDAHPDVRVFRISAAAKVPGAGVATVEILDPLGKGAGEVGFNDASVSWLKLSQLNLYRHQVSTAGITMQQPGNPGQMVRPKYVPYAGVGHNVMTWEQAQFGMCYKINTIPFTEVATTTSQEVYLYADELLGGNRSAKIRITYNRGDAFPDEVKVFDVSQSGSILIAGNYIENNEEKGILLSPGLPPGLQGSNFMQWGYSGSMLYAAPNRYSYGNFLTANAVYTGVTGSGTNSPQWTVDNVRRPLYPYTGGQIVEPVPSSFGAPYYIPLIDALTPPTSYYHPIYNSSAARYCHEKNRDMDGDGIISQSETHWYLPSFADLWALRGALSGVNENLWTSSEEDNNEAWFLNPTQTPTAANTAPKTASYQVRCIRGTGAVNLSAATISTTPPAVDTKNILIAQAGGNTSFDVNDISGNGLQWTVTSSDPSWLTIRTSAVGTASSQQVGVGSKIGTSSYYIYATSNASGTRSATITLTRAGQPKTPLRQITVTQAKPNLRAFPNVIAYDPLADGGNGMLKLYQPGDVIPPYAYTVYFKYGSIIGIASGLNNDVFTTADIVFNPRGKAHATWAAISVPSAKQDITEAYHSANWQNSLGDPCRLVGLTKDQINSNVRSTWKTSTYAEYQTYTNSAINYLPLTDYTLAANAPNGYNIDGCYFPKGTQNSWLPCAGVRSYADGKVTLRNSYGSYWTSTAAAAQSPAPVQNTGENFMFYNGSVVVDSANAYGERYHDGQPIRCVPF